jgi:hypothetical protein
MPSNFFRTNNNLTKKTMGLLTLLANFLNYSMAEIPGGNFYFYDPTVQSRYRYKIQEVDRCDTNLFGFVEILIANCSAIPLQMEDNDFIEGFSSYCATLCTFDLRSINSYVRLTIHANDNSTQEFEQCMTGLLESRYGKSASDCNPSTNELSPVVEYIIGFLFLAYLALRIFYELQPNGLNFCKKRDAKTVLSVEESEGEYALFQDDLPDEEEKSFSERLKKIGYRGTIPENLLCPLSNSIINDPVTFGLLNIAYDKNNLINRFALERNYKIECPRSKQIIRKIILSYHTNNEIYGQLESFVEGRELQSMQERNRLFYVPSDMPIGREEIIDPLVHENRM